MRGVLPQEISTAISPLRPAAATSKNLGRDSAYPSRRRHNRPQPRQRDPQIERPSPIDFCAPRARGGDGTVLGDLLENCVAEVLLRLDPLEICRMARLSRMFRGAASGDGVWESKLLTNYARLLAVAAAGDGEAGQAAGSAPEAEPLPKKELYARLCRRNRFDGGKKVLVRLHPELHVTSFFVWLCLNCS
jgi:hypothetical protein